MHRIKKPILITLGLLILLFAIVILFISPITKHLVEKYDEKYTGRRITMDWAYVNPFTGYIYFSGLNIYEPDSDSLFISANSLSADFALYKLFSNTYEISQCTLDKPRGMLIQNRKALNFDDIIKRFSPDTSAGPSEPLHLNILGIKINEGEFYYNEQVTPIKYFLKRVNIESEGIRWDSDTIVSHFSFMSGVGTGDLEGDFTINTKNLDYRFAAVAHKFDLNIIQQYLKELTNYGIFSASLDADVKAKGNFNDAENITASGMLAINAFHFGKNVKEDYASFDKLILSITELSPKNRKYLFDSVALTRPYFKYERYDYLDNFETMFGKGGSNISSTTADSAQFNLIVEIARYVKVLARNFFESSYKVNRLAIYDGNLKFNDYSLSEKFSISLDPLYVFADSIDKNNKRVKATFKSGIKPYGEAAIHLSINPKDSSDFDMDYRFQKLSAAMFNPYTVGFTSFPLDRGTIELNGTWKVRNGNIQSDNHLVVIDPRVANRLKNKELSWLPMPLILYFVRERGNVIDYEIPITGNLKDPRFHIKDVVLDLVENIFVKPVTTPYRVRVKTIETEIEKSLTLKWPTRSSFLRGNQERFIKRMARFLAENPEASVTIQPMLYTAKEKESILFFEAKKKYWRSIQLGKDHDFSEDDSVRINKMSIKDTSFTRFINDESKGTLLFTTQDKCARIIDSTVVNAKYNRLNEERERIFKSYFQDKEVEKQVVFSDPKTITPYNGFSFYKISYKGEIPKDLLESYEEMNELNDQSPREKFKSVRRKLRRLL